MALSVLTIVIRKRAYEIFSNLHFGSAILILIASWRHLRILNSFSQLYLLVGSAIFVTTTACLWFMLLCRNINYSKLGSRAQVTRVENGSAAQLIIPVNRPFAVKPGMVLYLWIPGVSLFSIFQTHPFFIGWWDNNSDGKATSITLLVRKQNGFTRRLIEHPARSFLTWIDGPYGTTPNLDQYNRALLVATGIGIAAQLSYLRCLVETNIREKVHRDIYVAWEVDRECQCFEA
jgi:predicted ferric reductase